MTPKGRFLAALALDMPDRVPTMHIQLGGANYLQERTGTTIKEAYADPQKFARMCMASLEFGFDNVMVGWGDLLNEAQAFGVQLAFPNDRDYPRGTPISPDRIEELEIIDPMRDDIWAASLKAAKIVNGAVGNQTAVIGQVSDPFTLAVAVRGFDGLLMDEIMETNRTHHLLHVITGSLKEYGRLLKDYAGVEIVFIEDGSADAEQNVFEFAKVFDIDYARKMTESYQPLGLMSILSNCAKEPYLDAQLETVKPTAIHTSFEWSGYGDAVTKLRGRACLAAGILPHFIARSDPDTIRQKVNEVVRSSGDGSGFIVTSAGEIPFDAPLENIKALNEADALKLLR
jgi:uroporphyrinogen-III decarboxylase